MNKETELIFQGFQIELSKITLAITELKNTTLQQSKYEKIPAWVNLDMAAELKGGCCPQWMKNTLCLQPCCGTNYKLIGGRKCWSAENIIEWLEISDSDLKAYAAKWGVSLPEKYKRRGA